MLLFAPLVQKNGKGVRNIALCRGFVLATFGLATPRLWASHLHRPLLGTVVALISVFIREPDLAQCFGEPAAQGVQG